MLDSRPPGSGARALALWRRRPAPSESRAIADPGRVARVLILKPHDQLGDFLLATPAIRALRDRFPRAQMALLTREFLAPLALRDPDLDRVWTLPRVRGLASLGRLIAAVLAVMRFRPDLAVVANSVSRSKSADALAVLSGARLIVGRSRVFAGPVPEDAPEDPWQVVIGAGSRDPIYDLDLDVARRSTHQIERLLDLVRWCGADAPPVLRLELGAAERAAGKARLEAALSAAGIEAGPSPVVGIHPGAANALKCWPLESFVALGVGLAGPGVSRPVRLAVFDSPREPGRAAAVVAGLSARGVAAALIPAAGIEGFAAATAALDLLACNDSGVLHVAAALGVPTVSFHALGRPREWGARGDRAVAFDAPGRIETIPVPAALEAIQLLLAEARPA